MKNGSTPSVRAGRQSARPTAWAAAPDSARAALLGLKPISSAMARMRRRVASDTPGWPLSAYDTAPLDTPARRATSAIVGRFTGAAPIPWSVLVGSVREVAVTVLPSHGGRTDQDFVNPPYVI